MSAVSEKRTAPARKPHIYLHVYANGLRFLRVVPLEHIQVRFKQLTMRERKLRQDAYDFVSRRNMEDYGKRGMYDT